MLNDRESNVCYSSADAKLKFVCNSVGLKTTTTKLSQAWTLFWPIKLGKFLGWEKVQKCVKFPLQ